MKSITEPQWVGVDVSQGKLDIALRPAGSTWQVPNTASGCQTLCDPAIDGSHCISSGGVHWRDGTRRGAALTAARVAVAVINPKRARDFSKALGRLANTDRIDAEMLAHLGEALKPLLQPLASEEQEALSDLVHRRYGGLGGGAASPRHCRLL